MMNKQQLLDSKIKNYDDQNELASGQVFLSLEEEMMVKPKSISFENKGKSRQDTKVYKPAGKEKRAFLGQRGGVLKSPEFSFVTELMSYRSGNTSIERLTVPQQVIFYKAVFSKFRRQPIKMGIDKVSKNTIIKFRYPSEPVIPGDVIMCGNCDPKLNKTTKIGYTKIKRSMFNYSTDAFLKFNKYDALTRKSIWNDSDLKSLNVFVKSIRNELDIMWSGHTTYSKEEIVEIYDPITLDVFGRRHYVKFSNKGTLYGLLKEFWDKEGITIKCAGINLKNYTNKEVNQQFNTIIEPGAIVMISGLVVGGSSEKDVSLEDIFSNTIGQNAMIVKPVKKYNMLSDDEIISNHFNLFELGAGIKFSSTDYTTFMDSVLSGKSMINIGDSTYFFPGLPSTIYVVGHLLNIIRGVGTVGEVLGDYMMYTCMGKPLSLDTMLCDLPNEATIYCRASGIGGANNKKKNPQAAEILKMLVKNNKKPIKKGISSVFKTGGGLIGGYLGNSSLGQDIGGSLANKFSKLIGSGDYEVAGNQTSVNNVMKGSSYNANMSFSTDADVVVISKREYVTEITTSAAAGSFAYNAFSVNPGLGYVFPWLAGIANNFEYYDPVSVIFETISTCNTGSSVTTNGMLVHAAIYNTNNAIPTNKLAMQSYGDAVSSRFDVNTMHGIECAANVAMRKWYYVRSGTSALPLIDTDVCNMVYGVAPSSSFPTLTSVAELWVTYTIRFTRPRPAVYTTLSNNNYASASEGSLSSAGPTFNIPTYFANGYNLAVNSTNSYILSGLNAGDVIFMTFTAKASSGMTFTSIVVTNSSGTAAKPFNSSPTQSRDTNAVSAASGTALVYAGAFGATSTNMIFTFNYSWTSTMSYSLDVIKLSGSSPVNF